MPAPTKAQYLASYLVSADLPRMTMVSDSRLGGAPRPDDTAFAEYRGRALGRVIWQGDDNAAVWQIMDLRFAFPDRASAVRYHRARLGRNAEGAMPVRGAPPIGDYCAVFGGIRDHPFAADETVTHYYYLFVVDSLLVKLFAAMSPVLPEGTLTPAHLAPIARTAQLRAAVAVADDRPGDV
jgi:hypothetical protein